MLLSDQQTLLCVKMATAMTCMCHVSNVEPQSNHVKYKAMKYSEN